MLGPQTHYFTRDDVFDILKFIGDYDATILNALDCYKDVGDLTLIFWVLTGPNLRFTLLVSRS